MSISPEMKRIDDQIKKIAEKSKLLNKPHHLSRHNKEGHVKEFLVAASILLLFTIGLFYLGFQYTGFVTFSESYVASDLNSFDVQTSGKHYIHTDLDNINSILLSGTVHGKGRAQVWLLKDSTRHLIYQFDGDAKTGHQFSNMCYGTCHIPNMNQDNLLEFILDGTSMHISRITYSSDKLVSFSVEPKLYEIDYQEDPASIIYLKLKNNQHSDFKVLLYIDGPFSSSFSWQGSLIHMNAETPEKLIMIRSTLPTNLPNGVFDHKVTARYIPPDTHEYSGSAPTEEAIISVINQ